MDQKKINEEPTQVEDNAQWVDLYEYIRKDIFGYDKNTQLPRNLTLRLRGLRHGKFMVNKSKPLGNYSYKLILITFKMCKLDIIRALTTKKFKAESHKINYVMVIIEDKINDTYIRIKRVENAQEKGERIEINNDNNKAEYKHKTKVIKNSRLKHLL